MISIPYGISNYEKLINDGCYYVDRTNYIALLEKLGEPYLFLVRPRRFGKSLFVSTLQHYYGIEYKDKFQQLFGKYYIGQHPTPLANSYLVLSLSFTGIHTDTPELTLAGFLRNVKSGVQALMSNYSALFTEEDWEAVSNQQMPSDVISFLLLTIKKRRITHKIYVLIDEYDHFANELLAFDFSNFKNIVSKNGFVRKFYEILKEGTHSGIIDRMFITGVTPITLDSLTSGFNIASKLTTDVRFNELFGFTKEEVIAVVNGIGMPAEETPFALQELAFWYNGYLFNIDASERIYNPDMILYFAKEYLANNKYPKDLLDTNIASDYRKIRNLFKINDKEAENLHLIQKLLSDGYTVAQLTREFNFERAWTSDDLVSLLFYQGILTIKDESLGEVIFEIPNAVIKQLYYQYLHQLTLEETQLSERQVSTTKKVLELARHNNIQPLMDLVQDIISHLATHDRAHFNELTFKAIFTSLFYTTQIFKIYSELEVRKSATEKGRLDLLLLERQPYHLPHQFVFELKYVNKKDIKKWASIKKGGVAQLKEYLKHDEQLRKLPNLQAYVLLFSNKKVEAIAIQ